MARRNYIQTYDLKTADGRTVKRHRAFWNDAAGIKRGKVLIVKLDAQAFIDSKTTDALAWKHVPAGMRATAVRDVSVPMSGRPSRPRL